MDDLTSILIAAAPFLAVGAAVGAVYFLMLYRWVRQQAEGGAVAAMLPLYLLRLAGAGLFFWLVAQEGAVPLLAALAGFLAARSLAQHLVRRV